MRIIVQTYATTKRKPAKPPKTPAVLGIQPIPNRIVGFYGHKSQLRCMSAPHQANIKLGLSFHRVELHVDVENNKKGRVGLDNLDQVSLVDLTLCKVNLRNDIIALIGRDGDTISEALSRNPAAINKAWKQPQYQHIQAFVADVHCEIPARVAFIRDTSDITEMIVT